MEQEVYRERRKDAAECVKLRPRPEVSEVDYAPQSHKHMGNAYRLRDAVCYSTASQVYVPGDNTPMRSYRLRPDRAEQSHRPIIVP